MPMFSSTVLENYGESISYWRSYGRFVPLPGLFVTKSRRKSYIFSSVRKTTLEERDDSSPFLFIILSNPCTSSLNGGFENYF